ncbi:hypothetical protein SeMB42_g00095 [Synchytrium endobioticum]|uniref:LIM zinc-binding domain-containing protein n=1 Tax=Synchytrium endobioticum TaxID=286115 RepID=A0A507DJ31_9FUNG|nr:hypothetical protein SeLEV6574_g00175 [Synchytrium endobioticum]TPX54891.1 hypothetical protein SeMB42_g00095 [Synchytrium endobioticum]
MGFCGRCGEIVQNSTGVCRCGGRAADSATSGWYQDAYISACFRSGLIEAAYGQVPCIQCHKHLTKDDEVFSGPAGKGGHLYCQDCYVRNFRNIVGPGRQASGRFWDKDEGNGCHECSQVIYGKGIQALDRIYHPNCFRCFNCKTHLTLTFIDFNSEPACHACRGKIQQQRPDAMRSGGEATSKVSQMTATMHKLQQFNDRKNVSDSRRCGNCLEVVTGGGTQLPNGLLFHDHCFMCDECGGQITGNKGLICKKCDKAISGRFLKAEEFLYHDTCFTCSACGNYLANAPYGDLGKGATCEPCLKAEVAAAQVGGSTITNGQRPPGFTVNPMTGVKESAGSKDSSALHALGGTTTCPRCKKATYALDQTVGPINTKWHRSCLACVHCHTRLDSHAKMIETTPYCWKCFDQVKR